MEEVVAGLAVGVFGIVIAIFASMAILPFIKENPSYRKKNKDRKEKDNP